MCCFAKKIEIGNKHNNVQCKYIVNDFLEHMKQVSLFSHKEK